MGQIRLKLLPIAPKPKIYHWNNFTWALPWFRPILCKIFRNFRDNIKWKKVFLAKIGLKKGQKSIFLKFLKMQFFSFWHVLMETTLKNLVLLIRFWAIAIWKEPLFAISQNFASSFLGPHMSKSPEILHNKVVTWKWTLSEANC